ncbi:DMT family transporter [Halobacteriaceae archaeon GCM10025711]
MAVIGVAIVAVSTSAILVKASAAPNLVKAFYRVLFTTFLIAPFALTGYRDEFRKLSGRDFGIAVVTGVALAAHFATWFESLSWTSVAASVTLVQSQPLFVALGAALVLGERVTGRMVGGILVAVTGSVVMSVGGLLDGGTGPAPLYGDALAVAGAIFAAAYVLVGRSLRQRVSLVPYVLIVYSACTVVLLGLVVGNGLALGGYPPVEWALFLGMAVGPGIFGHTAINWALKYVESSVVSVSLLGEPVGSTILAMAVFSEFPGVGEVLGGAIVLTGIYVTTTGRATTGG